MSYLMLNKDGTVSAKVGDYSISIAPSLFFAGECMPADGPKEFIPSYEYFGIKKIDVEGMDNSTAW
jgi:hypothetical protein